MTIGLLDKIEKSRSGRKLPLTRVVSVTSGKGGVGKSSITLNLAIALARAGARVLVLDADLGLANLNVLLGLKAKYTLEDVLKGERLLEEIMLDGPEGISLIPSASGVETICNLKGEQRLVLMEAVENVAYRFDYLLIDTAAGIGSDVLHFNSASGENICVVSDEPTSLTDAYALIKVLSRGYAEREIMILVNNAPNQASADRTFSRIQRAAERFLQVKLNCLGWVPKDGAVPLAVSQQRALLELYPSSAAAVAITRLARALDSDFQQYQIKGGVQFFFRQLMELEASS